MGTSLIVTLALLTTPELAGLKSGPQVGEGVPGGFPTQFINGDHAGMRRCPV